MNWEQIRVSWFSDDGRYRINPSTDGPKFWIYRKDGETWVLANPGDPKPTLEAAKAFAESA